MSLWWKRKRDGMGREKKKRGGRWRKLKKKIGDGVEDDFCFARPEMEGNARQTEESRAMRWDEMR